MNEQKRIKKLRKELDKLDVDNHCDHSSIRWGIIELHDEINKLNAEIHILKQHLIPSNTERVLLKARTDQYYENKKYGIDLP